MSKNAVALAVAFTAGCGAAAVAPLVIPARAQTTQRWEVSCLRLGEYHRTEDAARAMSEVGNVAGRDGWEPYGFATGSAMCFKRPAP